MGDKMTIQDAILETIRRARQPLEFLDLADRVAPHCNGTLLETEQVIRNLLEERLLTYDTEFRILAAHHGHGSANGHKTNSQKAKAVASKQARRAKVAV